MLHPPQGPQLQGNKLLHEILKREALISFDLPQRPRLPVEREAPDRLGFFARRGMLPMMQPDIDGRRASIVAPTLLDILFIGEVKRALSSGVV